jgi:iron(II)-dependent oxidoreductase
MSTPCEELIVSSSDDLRTRLIEQMTEARARTLLLIGPVAEDDLRRQHDPLMGPILWDLGHIAEFEHLWLVLNLGGEVRFGEMPGLYNPFEHPRRVRGELQLPSLSETTHHMAEVRARALDGLLCLEPDSGSALLRDGYVYRMVLQHEHQHNETILQTLKLKQGEPYRAPRAFVTPPGALSLPEAGSMVRFPGGTVRAGSTDRSAAYDNERPAHAVELAPFWIDAVPVTNGQYLEFMEDGGYGRREFWSAEGWAWREANPGCCAPKYWVQAGSAWLERSYDQATTVRADHPVCHVCYFEAEAYARWAGRRLPTELEWEAAATWDPVEQRQLEYPWGDRAVTITDANVDHLMFDTVPVGSYRANVSPVGCYGMIGDVWEWTSSDFTPYPGFEAFPYREYSEPFFGTEYKVLRGGSWATRPLVARTTFRNWDYPIRRQIFSGFRCARNED